jgi:hypothetical protein
MELENNNTMDAFRSMADITEATDLEQNDHTDDLESNNTTKAKHSMAFPRMPYRRLDLCNRAYRFQSESLCIPDRFGLFSSGPPSRQMEELEIICCVLLGPPVFGLTLALIMLIMGCTIPNVSWEQLTFILIVCLVLSSIVSLFSVVYWVLSCLYRAR